MQDDNSKDNSVKEKAAVLLISTGNMRNIRSLAKKTTRRGERRGLGEVRSQREMSGRGLRRSKRNSLIS